jgi:uncharacterized membrane protein
VNRRRAIAVLALLGALDSIYLLFHKLGYLGSLACTEQGACDIVNTSAYSTFLGLPVALYGVLGYVTILAVAVVGAAPERADQPMPDRILAVLAVLGAAFSIYLTYVSFAVIGAACPWCLVSLGLIVAILALSGRGALRGKRGPRPAGSGSRE